MPLSKQRDRERKQLEKQVRLENKQFQPKQPRVYRRELHHTYEVGEVVLVRRGTRMVEMVVPELDADGRVIYD